MFDFIKYVRDEINGIDTVVAEREMREKRLMEKQNRFIFTKRSKIIVALFGVLYLLVAIMGIYFIKTNNSPFMLLVKYFILVTIDIVVLVSLCINNNKKAEIIALTGSILFVVLNFTLTALM